MLWNEKGREEKTEKRKRAVKARALVGASEGRMESEQKAWRVFDKA